jgi:AcrR family transcriptional regulator
MTRPQDRRVRRTRAALLDALLGLMVEKGYDAVTVQDLIDRADIGRSTFYAHFTDKSDLLHEALAGLRATLAPPPGSPPPDRRRPLPFSLHLFRHVHDVRQLLAALLTRNSSGTVTAEIEEILREAATAELTAVAAAAGEPRVPVDLLARSVVAGCLATLSWWVDGGFRQSPEELETLFRTLTTPAVRAALPAPAA